MMFIAMNRFKIVLGKEAGFEKIWRERDSRLDDVPGFIKFHLITGNESSDHTLYSHIALGIQKQILSTGQNHCHLKKRIKVLVVIVTCILGILCLRGLRWFYKFIS